MPSLLKAVGVAATYVVTVGGVGAALILTADDDTTSWLAVLAAMAVLHLGFGILFVRWSVALLPLVASVGAVLIDVGGFSITTLLVGVPCAMLVVAGVSLRIGWDGGPRASPVAQIRRARRRDQAGGDAEWDPVQPHVWDDAVA
ncbi:MAG TPA: hypothetical protein VNT03_04305 [Baekduia sp.]|nr:hypothetical protein [Baekduia sp.]